MPGPDHHYIMIRPFHLYITFFYCPKHWSTHPHTLTHPHILTSSFLTPHTHIPSHLTHTHTHSHLTHTHTLTSYTHTHTHSHLTHTAEDMEYTLSDEFCRRHFLVGVLLREVHILFLSSAPPPPPPPTLTLHRLMM